MKVPVLSSLILFHARQAGGGYHSFLPSGGGPRTHTGALVGKEVGKKMKRKGQGRQEARKEVGQKTQRDESTCP